MKRSKPPKQTQPTLLKFFKRNPPGETASKLNSNENAPKHSQNVSVDDEQSPATNVSIDDFSTNEFPQGQANSSECVDQLPQTTKVPLNESFSNANQTSFDNVSDMFRQENLPSCWNPAQAIDFHRKNNWLIIKSQKLGCQSCISAYDLSSCNDNTAQWIKCDVKENCSSKIASQASLRKKITKHASSITHIESLGIVERMKNNPIEAGFSAPLSIEKEATANCFKIAYHICKKNQPLHNYEQDVALAKSLKSVVGSSLHSRWSGQRIADHIGTRMRKIAVSKLIEGNAKFGIMVDEASTVSKMSTMTVHLRYVFPTNDKEAIAVPFFLDLVQVDDTCAETLFSSLINCLHKWGFKDKFIQNNLISFSTDGASNMTGKYSGLATRVLETFPNIIVWWCLNHRLQLSLDDAVKEIKQVSHFKSFMNGIYKQFSKSNLKTTKLASISNELETDITRIGRVFGPRWAAFSERSAAAVLQSYGPLYKFFSEDPDLKGFAVRLESKEFLKDLILMNDILHELGILSSALQSNQISIYDANQRIQLSINVFKKWKDDKSSYLDKVKTYEEKLSSLIKFKSLRKAKNIDREKLLQVLIQRMEMRLLSKEDEKTVKLLNYLEPSTWNVNEVADPWLEAEGKLEELSKIVKVEIKTHEFRSLVTAYRRKQDIKQTILSLPSILEARNNILAFSVSTAEAERGFSKMNLILSDLRNRLTILHVSNLMAISIMGPPPKLFDPIPYVETWLKSHRHACSTQVRESKEEDPDEYHTQLWELFNESHHYYFDD